jgi:hypothetical protein
MISKRVHQRTTNRLAEATRAITRLDADQVLAVVRDIVEVTPVKTSLLSSGQRLWLFGKAPGPWNVYYGPPSKREPGKVVRVWRCEVTIRPSSDGSSTLIGMSLAQWKTVDGRLVARREFEEFRDSVMYQIADVDPSFQQLTTS